MLQGVAKCYAQKLGTKNVIAFFPSETQKRIIYVWHGSCSIYRYKKERMKMRKSSYYRGSDDGYDYSRDNRNGEVDIFLKSLESYYAEKKRKEEEEKKESK
jgi:hypothetical protein